VNALKHRLHQSFFALFLALLCTPLVLSCFDGGAATLLAKLRKPVSEFRALPKASLSAIDSLFTQGYSLRTPVVQAFNYLQLRVFSAPSVSVIIGRDDWLFYTGNGTFEDYCGRLRFSPAELDHWAESLRARRDWLAARGVKHLLVIVPNKNSVCEDKLPSMLRLQHQSGRLDQLVDTLRAKQLEGGVLSLRPFLREQYQSEINYWPTDSHWNAQGLLLACDKITERLVAMGVTHPASDYKDCMAVRSFARQGDCVRILQMQSLWPAKEFSEVYMRDWKDISTGSTALSQVPPFSQSAPETLPVAVERPSGQGRAVLLCDSFFRVGGLAPEMQARVPLAIHLRRLVSYWNWTDAENKAGYDCLSRILELEHPDVIIETITERYLGTPPPDRARFEAALRAAQH